MKLEKQWKPSGAIANARYRGVTDLAQYSNFILETVHDMNLLSHLLTGNEKTNTLGHEKEIEDNYISLFNGDVSPASYNSFTASNICKVDRNRPVALPALDQWEKINGCTVSKSGTAYTLTSNGQLDPCGIRTGLFVMPGDVIYIRLKIKTTTSGGVKGFAFGSQNLNNGAGSLKKMDVSVTNDGFFVDYRLYCMSQETVFLNLYVHNQPSVLKAQSIEIQSMECFYANEVPVGVTPLNGELKRDLNEMRETINFLKK